MSLHYIATKSLSNSNGDHRPMQIATCTRSSICINGSVASREPCSSVALLQRFTSLALLVSLLSAFLLSLPIFFSVSLSLIVLYRVLYRVKKYVKNLRRYSSYLKDEKMLYGHRCGNAYFRNYVQNTVSCITYTRKNLGLIIVDDNRLVRLIYIWF